jgi:hypothetical protein
MAKKPDTPVDLDKRGRAASGTGVVIRDESDEIIDNLKRQLETLRGQLAKSRSAAGAGGATGDAAALHDLKSDLAPYLASKLESPAGDLTQRLGRLVEQVSDPELRKELEQCRDTASYLFNTFRRIRDNHRLLTDSLAAEKIELSADAFCRELGESLRAHGHDLPRVEGLRPGLKLKVASGAAAAVVATLAELVTTLFGPPVLTAVDLAPVQDAGAFRLRIATPRPWDGVEGEEITSLALRGGMRAHSVVDLLYVEKIVELQGGAVTYLRENGRVHGLEVTWPSR